MKVLFIGEGSHDLGTVEFDLNNPPSAIGVIPTLARKVCDVIDTASLVLRWKDIPRLHPPGKKKGFDAKVAAAIVISKLRFSCAGTICVADRDGDPDRLPDMQEGKARGLKAIKDQHPIACGVAVESIEAWTLGDPKAIAGELGLDEKEVRKHYRTKDVESFSESSGKPEYRPKSLLDQIAQLSHRSDSAGFRQLVAKRTDIVTLEKACPTGFAPFAAELRAAFPSQTG